MRRATVSAKVGMDCLGSLMVRRCSMPSSPYQLRSLMNPVPFVVLPNASYMPRQMHRVKRDERGLTRVVEHDYDAV